MEQKISFDELLKLREAGFIFQTSSRHLLRPEGKPEDDSGFIGALESCALADGYDLVTAATVFKLSQSKPDTPLTLEVSGDLNVVCSVYRDAHMEQALDILTQDRAAQRQEAIAKLLREIYEDLELDDDVTDVAGDGGWERGGNYCSLPIFLEVHETAPTEETRLNVTLYPETKTVAVTCARGKLPEGWEAAHEDLIAACFN